MKPIYSLIIGYVIGVGTFFAVSSIYAQVIPDQVAPAPSQADMVLSSAPKTAISIAASSSLPIINAVTIDFENKNTQKITDRLDKIYNILLRISKK